MIDQQLYLDGQLMDLGEDTSITLDIKSNLFRDVTKMTANNTYTVQLPKTVHNMTVLGLSCKPNASTDYPHVFHTARYYRNGLEIFSNGRASILSIEDDIELSIYWGVFPALTALRDSDIKLNELEISEYLTFNRWNSPDKYDDAIANGVFYAYYDTAQYDSTKDTWSNYSTLQQGMNTTAEYGLFDGGKILTGETVGATVTGKIIDDDEYMCAMAVFEPGETASIMGVLGKGEYRTWAILDANNNVIALADDVESNQPININMHAPANSACIIINALKSYSTGTVLTVKRNITGETTFATRASEATSDIDYSVFGGYNKGAIQPSVSCNYILQLIASKTGVKFKWSTKAEELINSLAIPLIARKSDGNTLNGGIDGDFVATEKLGMLSLNITETSSELFNETSGTVRQLSVKTDCTLIIDVQAYWSWDASEVKPSSYETIQNDDGTTSTIGVYTYLPCYIEMKIVSRHTSDQEESEYTQTYNIGPSIDNDNVTWSTYVVYGTSMVNGKFIHLITGRGSIDLAEGDIITFELKHPQNKTLQGLRCYNGIFSAALKQGDDVPYGGLFPIAKNLPDITIMSFVKFVCVITGTFPVQNVVGGVLQLISISEVLDKSTISERAVDWTKKLIPSGAYNQPRQMDYSVEDYCQHNMYKWKEDDTVAGRYDADMKIDNVTLEYTQDTYTMPFAASDNNKVPIYEWQDLKVRNADITQHVANKYKACKDRIMNVYKRDDGCAALRFGIDLQGMFDNELKGFRQMIANSRQITERMLLTDLDIRNFDETKPVYLAQYACYCMVLEIKTTDNGYCEVQMIKIY